MRHGPHQLAQNVTTTFFWPRKSERETVRPSRATAEKSGAGLSTNAGCSSWSFKVVSMTLARQVSRTVTTASTIIPRMARPERLGRLDTGTSLTAKESIVKISRRTDPRITLLESELGSLYQVGSQSGKTVAGAPRIHGNSQAFV